MDEACKVIKVIVNNIPKGCGSCPMMRYYEYIDSPRCVALPEEINYIEGNPYDMKYRRSDCPLELDNCSRI